MEVCEKFECMRSSGLNDHDCNDDCKFFCCEYCIHIDDLLEKCELELGDQMTTLEAISVLNNMIGQSEDLDRAISLAVDSLSLEIPRQPISCWEEGRVVVRCPNCNTRVYDADWSNNFKRKYFVNHCFSCGQTFTSPSNKLGIWEAEGGDSE